MGRSGPIFQKRTKCLKNTSGCIFECEKIFFHYSPPTITGSRSTIQVVDFGSVVSPIGIFQKCTKWLIGTLKRLFWPQKNFSNYVPPTIVIVDLPTIVDRKWFFQKFTKWLIGTPKRLFWPKKNFCNYGPPTIVIVDLPTIVGRKSFFQKFTKWLIDSLKRLFGPEKNFASMTTRM